MANWRAGPHSTDEQLDEICDRVSANGYKVTAWRLRNFRALATADRIAAAIDRFHERHPDVKEFAGEPDPSESEKEAIARRTAEERARKIAALEANSQHRGPYAHHRGVEGEMDDPVQPRQSFGGKTAKVHGVTHTYESLQEPFRMGQLYIHRRGGDRS